MDLDYVSVFKHVKKELGEYPAILTSHLTHTRNAHASKFKAKALGLKGKISSLGLA